MNWHKSVMVEEVLFFFKSIPQGATLIDATIGDGGHSLALLKMFEGKLNIIGIDRDPVMLERAKNRLKAYYSNVTFCQGRYKDVLARQEEKVAGVLFDFGVASFHFDESGRGFSFNKDEPLDMRFDPAGAQNASDLIQNSSQTQLSEIFREYGEERFAARIARAIKAHKGRIDTTGQLGTLVRNSIPSQFLRTARLNPATRVFQSLRIAVNGEIDEVETGLKMALNILKKGGRMVAISFHSIEDRAVKRYFRQAKVAGQVNILTKKPMVPGENEVSENPRSRSAKLRAVEKI